MLGPPFLCYRDIYWVTVAIPPLLPLSTIMEQMFAKVVPLLWQAAPTFLLIILLHFYLKAMLFKPLEKALEERKAATEGVRKQAREAREMAERRAAEYEESLRAARAEVYKEQDELRAELRKQQSDALASIRAQTEASIAEARARIAREREEAQAALLAESDALAEAIANAALTGRSN